MLTSLIRKFKETYYQHRFSAHLKYLKKTFAVTKYRISKKSDSHYEVKSLEINNEVIYDLPLITEHFNKHFSCVTKNLDDQIPNSNISPISFIQRNLVR